MSELLSQPAASDLSVPKSLDSDLAQRPDIVGNQLTPAVGQDLLAASGGDSHDWKGGYKGEMRHCHRPPKDDDKSLHSFLSSTLATVLFIA